MIARLALAPLLALAAGLVASLTLSGSTATWLVSGREEDAFRGLESWFTRLEPPLEAVLIGPEGHRATRAGLAALARLSLVRQGAGRAMAVRRADPAGASVALAGGRVPKLGEVVLLAGGRGVVARDASARALALALRALADPRPRVIRFLGPRPGPGAPEGYRVAAAALAGELAADVVTGPPDPGDRFRVALATGPDPAAGAPASLLEEPVPLLVLAEGPGPWDGVLAARGLVPGTGWIRDARAGPDRSVGTVRGRAGGLGLPPAFVLLPGVRPLVAAAGLEPWIEPLDAGEVEQGERPGAGGPTRPRAAREGVAFMLRRGMPFAAVVGDADWLGDGALREAGNRELLVALGSLALDGVAELPSSLAAPDGGVDPDLEPDGFLVLAGLALLVLPAAPVALAVLAARRGGAGGP